MEAADVQPAELEVRVKSLEEDLRTTRDDLTAARKQLAKSQRQLETAEMYNEDLRKQVDMLNQELHRYKRRQVEDRACQTEDMLAPWAVEASQQLPNSEGNTEATINEVDTTGLSLADSLRATAEAALSQTGTVYDETSGMYYDYTTGMYYDPNNHLHYDPNTGVYYYYDAQSQSYQFHSQVELPASHAADVREQGEEEGQKKEKKQKDKEKKKRKKRHKDDSEAGEMEVVLIDDEDKEVRKRRERKRHRKKKKRRKEKEEVEVEVIDISMGSDSEKEQEDKLRTNQKQPELQRTNQSQPELQRTNQSPAALEGTNQIHLALEGTNQEQPAVQETNQCQPALEGTNQSSATLEGTNQSPDALEGTNQSSATLDGTNQSPATLEGTNQSPGALEDGMDLGAELEEGEVVDSAEEDCVNVEDQQSEDSDSSSESEDSSGESEESDESALQWPPCIRVMVEESDTLRPGSLFIITCDGGTIGREKDMGHAIRIPDLNISKSHVEVSYDRGAAQYTVTDLGSQNGTLLNGQRISEPKCRSAPCPVSHGAVLQLGGTVLSLHIHNGTDTCDGCEPGLVMAAIAEREKLRQAAPVLSKEDKERQRRRELKQIKKKYQLEAAAFVVSKDAGLPGGYQDRAGARRQTVGSDNPYQKDDAPASVHQAIGTSNKGRKMLEKMGWKEGKGLGKTSQGRQEPVQVSLRESQSGLGASAPRDVESVGLKTGKGKNWRKARERFYAMEQAGQPPGPSRTMNQRSSWVKGETLSEPNVDSEPTTHVQGDKQQGALDKDVIKQQRQTKDVTKQQRPLDKDVKIFDD
ncbi:PREDICTED: angiogenic factor with G patch and FHA domains 1-like [Branchiostoma belcheri]|uniref:Angiogenic factor with G patch and FHA domains 1-like n=1 Tax=Branchiostoma belcheri TaxID=7741 RepID=A0A6P4XV13_BRABE|nr:PREDICTED: angiogenic factor with G patch and FHA domains 1-like [Branchiostoma belcheri]